jgi:uncharacterized membrane protein
MADKQDTHLVISYFDTFEAGEKAAKALKGWDKANKEVKLGAIGVLHETEKGKIKTKKYGPHNTGKGAKIGLVLGVLAAVLPPVGLAAGAVYGAVAGGVLGTFSKKGLGLNDEELAKFKGELDGGKAALVVICDAGEVDATKAELDSLGGKSEAHVASTDDLPKAAEEVKAPPPDEVEPAA